MRLGHGKQGHAVEMRHERPRDLAPRVEKVQQAAPVGFPVLAQLDHVGCATHEGIIVIVGVHGEEIARAVQRGLRVHAQDVREPGDLTDQLERLPRAQRLEQPVGQELGHELPPIGVDHRELPVDELELRLRLPLHAGHQLIELALGQPLEIALRQRDHLRAAPEHDFPRNVAQQALVQRLGRRRLQDVLDHDPSVAGEPLLQFGNGQLGVDQADSGAEAAKCRGGRYLPVRRPPVRRARRPDAPHRPSPRSPAAAAWRWRADG